MFHLALSVFQHIGSFNTSHFDILNWLAKIDMAWVKARFKAGGAREGDFSPSEETKLAFKFGTTENLKHMQSESFLIPP